ncbi:MAG: hypothetical protein ACPGGK_13560 [Pikeienuella sp.]
MLKSVGLFLVAALSACNGELIVPDAERQAKLIVDTYEPDVIRVSGSTFTPLHQPIVSSALCALAPIARANGYYGVHFNGGDNSAKMFTGGPKFGYTLHEPSLFFTGVKIHQSAGAMGLQGAPVVSTRATQPEYYANGLTTEQEYDGSPEIFDISRVEFDCGVKIGAKNEDG